MATNGIVGSVAALWRFPVKSMGGEQLSGVRPDDVHPHATGRSSRREPIMGAGSFPCAGVYAVVEATGMMRTGDYAAII